MGYRNRFGHPRPTVVQRYREQKAMLYRSDDDGAIEFDFAAQGIAARRQREIRKRYWHGA